MKELKYINKYFYKYRYRLLLGIVITIVSKVFMVFTPQLIGNSINVIKNRLAGKITEELYVAELTKNMLYLIVVALVAAIFTFLMRHTIIAVSRFIEFNLKNEIYEQYQNLSLNFYKKNRTGDLMNRISEDVGRVRMYTGPAIMYTLNMITLFVVVLVYMFSKAPSLAFYTLLPLPILSVSIYILSKLIHKRSTVVQEYLSKLSAYTQEAFSGISVIKAYGIEPQTTMAFEVLSTGSRQKQIDLTKVQALFFPMMILLIGLSNLMVIYIGGKQYINGIITEFGTIAEFIIYVNMLTWPVAILGWVTSMVQQAEASQKRINEFLKEEPQIKNLSNKSLKLKGDIVFEDVHFTYEDTNIEALKGVSFTLKSGESLAIIGKTGSGKSTILDLIGRLYNVNKGKLTIDTIPIEQIHLKSLRNHIGYVPQDAFLFSDSIKNNIKFGNISASDDKIIEVAKQAVVHKNIKKFTNGYDTILGERGITLSGGQKQRISIARAIIKDPEILLLDDCLSAVDTETEEKILKNLNKVSQNKTTIIVSHRIALAKNVDKIIVLDQGKIIQSGTHQELINENGYYKTLYLKQLEEKEI